MMNKIFGLFISLLTFSALAEYRVYQYLVKSTHAKAQDQDAYMVTSSLDPVSYKAYHSGTLNISVDLMRTWICPGYTGTNLAYCNSPYEKSKEAIQ